MLKSYIKDPRHRVVLIFLLRAVAIYITWFIISNFFIEPTGNVNTWLNARVATDGAAVLRLTGFEASTTPGINQTLITISKQNMVGVGNPCNGLELFILFAGFILCFPGNTANKLWFIPTGLFIIHVVNAARAAALAYIQLRYPQHLDFNHHYTFTILVYAIIFGLWMYWVNKFAIKKHESLPVAEAAAE